MQKKLYLEIKMNRCPNCKRFGLEYIGADFWKCIWRDCYSLIKQENLIKDSNFLTITNLKSINKLHI